MPAFRNAIKLTLYKKVWTSAFFRQNEPKIKFTYFLTQQNMQNPSGKKRSVAIVEGGKKFQ